MRGSSFRPVVHVVAAGAIAIAACEGTTRYEPPEAASGNASSSSATQGASTSNANATTGAGGAPSTASATTSSTGGAGGAGGGDAACVEPTYCVCVANAACTIVAEDCFCPCDEPCEAPCDCDCGGGAFLGCAPASITNPDAIEGLWLIGWSGGAHHVSWVRVFGDQTCVVGDGASLNANIPFYPCNGPGTWIFPAKPETILFHFPEECGLGHSVTFESWAGTPGWPTGCLQLANVEDAAMPGTPLFACRFPDDQCNADLSECTDPL